MFIANSTLLVSEGTRESETESYTKQQIDLTLEYSQYGLLPHAS